MEPLTEARERALGLLALLPDVEQRVPWNGQTKARFTRTEKWLVWLLETIEEAQEHLAAPAEHVPPGLASLYGAWRGVEFSWEEIQEARYKAKTGLDEQE